MLRILWANALKTESLSLASSGDTKSTPCVHVSPRCLATGSIARRSTRSCWTETRGPPRRLPLGSPRCARAEGARLAAGRAGSRGLLAGRGGEGRTREGRSGGRREWPESRKRASDGAAGWAGREALGKWPPGCWGRAGGEGPEASSARMRNKAAGQARATPARPPAGGRASWTPLGGDVRWPGLSGREVTAPRPPCVLVTDRLCSPHPRSGGPPSRSSWRKSPGRPPACPVSRRGARPPALGRSWVAPGGPGDERPRLGSGCEQDAVARDPGPRTLMPAPRPRCAFFSDTWPQADASQVRSELGINAGDVFGKHLALESSESLLFWVPLGRLQV